MEKFLYKIAFGLRVSRRHDSRWRGRRFATSVCSLNWRPSMSGGEQLHVMGQSLWLNNITRGSRTSGILSAISANCPSPDSPQIPTSSTTPSAAPGSMTRGFAEGSEGFGQLQCPGSSGHGEHDTRGCPVCVCPSRASLGRLAHRWRRLRSRAGPLRQRWH
jgi:hypothetical protein